MVASEKKRRMSDSEEPSSAATVDNSAATVDNSTTTVDNSAASVDNSAATVDNSAATDLPHTEPSVARSPQHPPTEETPQAEKERVTRENVGVGAASNSSANGTETSEHSADKTRLTPQAVSDDPKKEAQPGRGKTNFGLASQ